MYVLPDGDLGALWWKHWWCAGYQLQVFLLLVMMTTQKPLQNSVLSHTQTISTFIQLPTTLISTEELLFMASDQVFGGDHIFFFFLLAWMRVSCLASKSFFVRMLRYFTPLSNKEAAPALKSHFNVNSYVFWANLGVYFIIFFRARASFCGPKKVARWSEDLCPPCSCFNSKHLTSSSTLWV